MEMERKYLDLEVKSVGEPSGDSHGFLEGYGAVKGNIDTYNDVIRDGAFANLDKLIGSGFMGKSHDWDDAMGWVEEAYEDEYGLWIKLAFHSTQDAQDLRVKVNERIKAKKSVGLSIGYFTKQASQGTMDGQEVRFLDEIEVFEVSVVTMPANDRAQVLAAKGHSEPRAKQLESLTAQVESYVQRLHEIKQKGAVDERLQKFMDELSAVAALCLEAIDDLGAKTEAVPEFDSYPEGWEAILEEARQLTNTQ